MYDNKLRILSMAFHFPKKEKEILRFWLRNKIFEKSIAQRRGARDFVFYEGPPTANAKPGIHHVLSRVYKDIICRYKTMRGFRVLRKAGWDTHGLPVELEIEKKLGFTTKKDIEQYGIAKFNKKCRQSVWEYKKDWERLTERIGFWLDMGHPYITYENDYIETLWQIIKIIWEKGLLYQDYKVVPHCPRCGTALSSHEVALGYRTIAEPAIYVKFRLKNKNKNTDTQSNTFLLVWTTTPWTLPGNVAVAVHPHFDYIVAEQGGERFVLLKNRATAVLGNGYTLIRELKGEDIAEEEYEPLFPASRVLSGAYRVICEDFVSAEEGTGLVHIAPAFGEDDMEAGKKHNLPLINHVNETGRFTEEGGDWSGMFVKDADPLIIKELKARGLLFKEETYQHDYPFCWRCSSPLLYYAKKSWFIKVTAIKDDLLKENKKINWIPAHIKEGRFGEWLKEIKDWAFSRERYWGTPLPLWECKNCHFQKVIGSKRELINQKFTHNKYVVMRHGHSLRQVTNKIASWPERFHCPLTRKGVKQIKNQVKKLKRKNIDLIYSSDLLRTRQTAEIIARELGIPLKFDKRLRELDGGIFNGKHMTIFQKWGRWADPAERFRIRLPQGEHYGDVQKRMYHFLCDIDKRYSKKTILIISHELPISVLEGAVRGFSQKEILSYRSKRRIDVGEYRLLPFAFLPHNESGELDFHRPFIDAVRFLCDRCGESMERISEIADVWFDSGAMPFAQNPHVWSFQQKRKNQILSRPELFPADYIAEAVDQTRGWFYTLLAVSTLLGFGAPYRNVISLGHVLDEKGEKMSKTKGNVVDPWKIIEQYGSDAVRWYFFTINQPGDQKLFAEKDIKIVFQGFMVTLWNAYMFWKTYAVNAKARIHQTQETFKSTNILDKWIISRLIWLIESVTQKLDAYEVVAAARAIEKFVVDDFSQWYIRRSRRRLQKPKTKREFEEASTTLVFILLQLSKLCAPFIPFLSEELYQKFGSKKSVHLEEWPSALKAMMRQRDVAREKQMEKVREIVRRGLAERAKAGVRIRQPLAVLEIEKEELEEKDELLQLIKEELNVKEIIVGTKFSLDTTITDELREEGFLRDLIRQIQEMRKNAGLRPHQFISLFYEAPKSIEAIFLKYRNDIARETKSLHIGLEKREGMKELRIGGESVRLLIIPARRRRRR